MIEAFLETFDSLPFFADDYVRSVNRFRTAWTVRVALETIVIFTEICGVPLIICLINRQFAYGASFFVKML